MIIRTLGIILFALSIFITGCNQPGLPYEKKDISNKLEFMLSLHPDILANKYSTDDQLKSGLEVCFNCVNNEEKYNAEVMLWEHLETLGSEKSILGISDNDVYEVVNQIITGTKEEDEYDYAYTDRVIPLHYLFVLKAETLIDPEIIKKGDSDYYISGTFSGGLIDGNILVFDLETETYLGAFHVTVENSDTVNGNLRDNLKKHLKATIIDHVELLDSSCDPII